MHPYLFSTHLSCICLYLCIILDCSLQCYWENIINSGVARGQGWEGGFSPLKSDSSPLPLKLIKIHAARRCQLWQRHWVTEFKFFHAEIMYALLHLLRDSVSQEAATTIVHNNSAKQEKSDVILKTSTPIYCGSEDSCTWLQTAYHLHVDFCSREYVDNLDALGKGRTYQQTTTTQALPHLPHY